MYSRTTVQCYDCHQHVADLKRHRTPGEAGFCKRSRRGGDAVAAVMASGRRGNAHMVGQALREERAVAQVVDGSKDYYVILDVSSSMTGARLEQAKQALLDIHEGLDDEDRLAVITFDTGAYFKLKPRPNGQLKRQGEIQPLVDRIYARGCTALYDAVWLAIEQIRDKTRETLLAVLTDGDDNSSSHTLEQVLALVDEYPSVTLEIIHVSADGQEHNEAYNELATKGRGKYKKIKADEIGAELNLVVSGFSKITIHSV